MKKMLIVLLLVCMSVFAPAFALTIESKSSTSLRFFPDGRILTTDEETPLSCYDSAGTLLWQYKPSPFNLAPSCMLAPDGLIAFLYHTGEEYVLAFLNGSGQPVHQVSSGAISNAVLMEEGLLYRQGDHLAWRNWQGAETHWPFDAQFRASFVRSLPSESRIYLYVYLRDANNRLSSCIYALNKNGTIDWTYTLGSQSDFFLSGWTQNAHGGVTLYVQRYDSDEGLPSHSSLLVLDEQGNVWSEHALALGDQMLTLQIMEQEADGSYSLYGSIKPIGASARDSKVVKAVFSPEHNRLALQALADGYGQCVRYWDNKLYLLRYAEDLTSVTITPIE